MMQTPLGSMTVNDSHCHFFSHFFLKTVAAQRFKEGDAVKSALDILGWEPPPQDPAELALRWTKELDTHGISRAGLIASIPGDEDSVAAAVARCPSRFVGLFMLDPTRADAVDRVRRGLTELNLHGICLFPAMHGYSLLDERLRGVLEVVNAKPGRTVFVHCGVLTVGFRTKLGLPSPFDLRLGNPLDLTSLAATYRTTNFIVPHLGSGLLREALMLADACPNVYLDTSSSNSWVRYLGITLHDALRQAVSVAGARRLVFGTDSSFFPRGWQHQIFEDQFSLLVSLGLDRESIAAIMGGNFDLLFPRTA